MDRVESRWSQDRGRFPGTGGSRRPDSCRRGGPGAVRGRGCPLDTRNDRWPPGLMELLQYAESRHAPFPGRGWLLARPSGARAQSRASPRLHCRMGLPLPFEQTPTHQCSVSTAATSAPLPRRDPGLPRSAYRRHRVGLPLVFRQWDDLRLERYTLEQDVVSQPASRRTASARDNQALPPHQSRGSGRVIASQACRRFLVLATSAACDACRRD